MCCMNVHTRLYKVFILYRIVYLHSVCVCVYSDVTNGTMRGFTAIYCDVKLSLLLLLLFCILMYGLVSLLK